MIADAVILADYGPPCSGESLRITLHGGGKVTVQPIFGDAVLAFDACLRAHDYRSRPGDTGGYACRKKRLLSGGFGDEWSTHAIKGTIDLNWLTNPMGRRLVTDYPPGMIRDIEGIRTMSGAPVWAWGGRWRTNKDAMHWQPACRRRDLVTGIDPRTVPGGNAPPHRPTPAPPPAAPAPRPTYRVPEDQMDRILKRRGHDHYWLRLADGGTAWISKAEAWEMRTEAQKVGAPLPIYTLSDSALRELGLSLPK